MAYTQKDLGPFVRGDDWTLKLTVLNSNGQIADITNYSYWLTLKADLEDADPGALQLTVVPIPAEAVQGIVTIEVPSISTGTLEPITYNYDIQQVDTSSKVQTLMLGKLKVVRDVTRSVSQEQEMSQVYTVQDLSFSAMVEDNHGFSVLDKEISSSAIMMEEPSYIVLLEVISKNTALVDVQGITE